MARTKSVSQEDSFSENVNTRYVYELALKNEKRGNVFDDRGRPMPEDEYKPRQNVLLRSAIVLDKDNEFGKPKGKHLIEYYDGCSSLFSEDHPKDQKTMETFRQSTREVLLNKGRVTVYGYDTLLKTYMDICSWNGASPYRVPTADAIFVPVDTETIAEQDEEFLDILEKALALAKNATEKKMRVHGKFLGIDEVDIKTQNPATVKAMRAQYRKAAQADPKEFIKTYNDKSIQVQNWIEKAMETGEISTSLIPNQAVWAKKGVVICDISGLKSKEGILNKLIEVAASEAGAEFNEHLSALYS